MKASKLTYLMAIAMALSFVATGCKHNPKNVTPLPDYSKTGPRDPGIDRGGQLKPDQNPGGTQELNPDLQNLENFNQDRAALAANTVHFDYDSIAIKSGERAHISAVADYMKGTAPNVALLIEGHCDERGTEEYNRSLGERRALALREALIASGASGARITTRSFGKDRKVDTGDSAAAHAKNRRGEFVVLTPK